MTIENTYPTPPKNLSDLNGFGPKSEEILATVDIRTVEEFFAIDPFELYKKIKPMKGIGLNSIYALSGLEKTCLG